MLNNNDSGVYGKAGNRNWKWKLEMEIGNGSGNKKKTHISLMQCFLHSVL